MEKVVVEDIIKQMVKEHNKKVKITKKEVKTEDKTAKLVYSICNIKK